MFDLLAYPPFQRAIIAACLCGVSCSILSVFVLLLRMPLIGIAMSHAAFAGAVIGLLAGLHPALSGWVFCLLTAGLLGPLSDRVSMAPENILNVLFSFLVGVAFLGLGIAARGKATALNLMWGSMLSLSSFDVALLAGVTLITILFVALLFKELQATLLNRYLAAVSGVPARTVYYLALILAGSVVSANLTTIGGILIFALLAQPAAIAYQWTYDLKPFFR